MRHDALRILLVLGCIGGSLALTMCSSGSGTSTTTSCPMGICGNGGGSSSSSTSIGGASSSTSTSVVSSTSVASSTSSGACTESWLCSPWDTGAQPAGSSNAGTRTCSDINHCGTTANKPVTTATLPALDVNYFECKVEPILDHKCSMLGCHGTESGRALRGYARAKLRVAAASFVDNANCANMGTMTGTQCIGNRSCPCNLAHTPTEWQRNYDAARGFALDAMGNKLASMDQSDLIQQPIVGGKAHAGIHLFKTSDPEHATLLAWLNGTTLASCNPAPN